MRAHFPLLAIMALLSSCSSSTTQQNGANGGPAGGNGGGDAAIPGDPGEPPETTGPDWLRGAPPPEAPAATHLFGAAAHADIAEAKARAILALERKLWGSVGDRPRLRPLPQVFAAEQDLTLSEPMQDGRHAVLVAIEREDLAARLRTWVEEAGAPELKEPSEDLPGAWLAAAAPPMRSYVMREFVCQRMKAAVESECAAGALGDHPLATVVDRIRLEADLHGGVPCYDDRVPLRPAGVRLHWRTAAEEPTPWPNVPLTFSAPDGVLASNRATTNVRGYAEVGFAGAPPEGVEIEVRIDLSPYLGQLAEQWPGSGILLELRTVTPTDARIAVHFFEQIAQEPARERTTSKAVARRLRALGYRNARVLPKDLVAALKPMQGDDSQGALAELARTARGRVDMLLVGESESEFLSRAVGRSVWHEAKSSAKLFDVWTGRHLGDAEEETRARGIGDFNAARRGMKEMGDKLADETHRLLSQSDLTAAGRAGPSWGLTARGSGE